MQRLAAGLGALGAEFAADPGQGGLRREPGQRPGQHVPHEEVRLDGAPPDERLQEGRVGVRTGRQGRLEPDRPVLGAQGSGHTGAAVGSVCGVDRDHLLHPGHTLTTCQGQARPRSHWARGVLIGGVLAAMTAMTAVLASPSRRPPPPRPPDTHPQPHAPHPYAPRWTDPAPPASRWTATAPPRPPRLRLLLPLPRAPEAPAPPATRRRPHRSRSEPAPPPPRTPRPSPCRPAGPPADASCRPSASPGRKR